MRRMTREDLDMAVDWAAGEGWNPGLADAECFYSAGPEGFLIAESQGKPLGSISAVAYDEQFGFIGLFIVRPEVRGRRVGVALGRAALAFLGDRNIGLDGVEAKVGSYEALGFKLAHRNVRYEGRQRPCAAPGGVVELSSVPFAEVVRYDRLFFPAPRRDFLSRWINPQHGRALGVLKQGRLAGYGVLRACRKGSKIGPLFADDPAVAESLFQALVCPLAHDSPFYLDAPETNPGAAALAQKYGMLPVFRTARMYSQAAPALPGDRIFGVTSFELG